MNVGFLIFVSIFVSMSLAVSLYMDLRPRKDPPFKYNLRDVVYWNGLTCRVSARYIQNKERFYSLDPVFPITHDLIPDFNPYPIHAPEKAMFADRPSEHLIEYHRRLRLEYAPMLRPLELRGRPPRRQWMTQLPPEIKPPITRHQLMSDEP